jgi:NADH dehydrogenase (ubiquinone) 1 alpha subcomplex subunit 2
VNKFYPTIKSSNPSLPILIRECSGVNPRIWLRFDHGRETSVEAQGKNPDDVWKELLSLAQPEKV